MFIGDKKPNQCPVEMFVAGYFNLAKIFLIHPKSCAAFFWKFSDFSRKTIFWQVLICSKNFRYGIKTQDQLDLKRRQRESILDPCSAGFWVFLGLYHPRKILQSPKITPPIPLFGSLVPQTRKPRTLISLSYSPFASCSMGYSTRQTLMVGWRFWIIRQHGSANSPYLLTPVVF